MRQRTTGLWEYDRSQATEGFTLISPLHTQQTYLIDMSGEVVHSWSHPFVPGNYAYLLENGNLLWSGETPDGPRPGGGKGGLLREYSWEGEIVWEYADDRQHHDFKRLSNGNTVYLGWEQMPEETAFRVQGAKPGTEDDQGVIWGDFLREVTPGGETVWEWHTHSGMQIEKFPLHAMSTRKEFLHTNAVTELPNGDFMVSFRKNSCIAIIEKATSQLVWHHQDDSWGQQHDCTMLQNGNILLFANGLHVPGGVPFSRVVEFDPESGQEVWTYKGAPPYTFFSPNISGAQRLWSGNTLICEGLNGRIFEVTSSGDIVWEFVTPWFGPFMRGESNSVFRAYRYAADSTQIRGRLGSN